MKAVINAVLTGRVAPFRGPDEPSAIDKAAIDRRVAIGLFGIEGDEQADRVHHGGPDKAIHHYPFDHYGPWRDEIGSHELLSGPGAFGENISTTGMDEGAICIGDRLRLGTALVEVSQGRQPCWKLDHRFGQKGITAAVIANGRAGWYYRVIETGMVEPGDNLGLVDRPYPQWSVDRVFALLIAGRGRQERGALQALAKLDVLAANWMQRARTIIAD